MLRGFLLVVIFHILIRTTTAQHAGPGPQPKYATCVRRFYEERSQFNACRGVPCFVFLTEIPFIVLDNKMTSEQDVKLFPCKDRKKTFPDLKGISFDIMDELPLDNAQCVWAGPHCSYEGMMQFIAREKDYQFVVGGLMFVLPHRVTNDTRPSSPLLDDKIVIVGRRDSRSAPALAYTTILRPFQLGTWMIILGVLLMFAVARILVAAAFVEKPYLKNIARHCMGEYVSNEIKLRSVDNQENLRLLNKAAVGSLSLAVSVFFVIVLLLYEISVVNFIFMKQTHSLQKGLNNLSEDEMKKYIIIQGGATEILWRTYVDPAGKYAKGIPPWHFCTGEKDCYDKILSDNHPAKFSMSYEVVVRYELKQRRACDLLTVYKTSTPLYVVTGGWFYGGVPIETQLNIDKAILELRLYDKIRQLVRRVIDTALPLNCAALGTDIPPAFLGWLVLSAVAACMIPAAASVICASMVKRSEQDAPNAKDETSD